VRSLLLAFLLLGTGCAPFSDLLVAPYVPIPIKVFDVATYEADVTLCRVAGANFKPQFSFGSALAKTMDGATSNASMIPVSPLVPAYGAAGAAASALGDGLDVASGQHRAVFKNCLKDFVHRDGSAIVADPGN
jgi:hypothetical protein